MDTVTVFHKTQGRDVQCSRGESFLSMADGRCWYECPVCRIGATGWIDESGVIPIHPECFDAVKREQSR